MVDHPYLTFVPMDAMLKQASLLLMLNFELEEVLGLLWRKQKKYVYREQQKCILWFVTRKHHQLQEMQP